MDVYCDVVSDYAVGSSFKMDLIFTVLTTVDYFCI